jgi:hypothetical protein
LLILTIKKKELSNDDICDMVINSVADKNNAFFQETRVNIERPFAVTRFLNHGWDKELVGGVLCKNLV